MMATVPDALVVGLLSCRAAEAPEINVQAEPQEHVYIYIYIFRAFQN